MITAIVTSAATATFGLVVWIAQQVYTTKKELRTKEHITHDVFREAVVNLMRQQLVSEHRAILTSGTVSPAERDNFIKSHNLYIRLGGNSAASHLIEDVEKLGIRL